MRRYLLTVMAILVLCAYARASSEVPVGQPRTPDEELARARARAALANLQAAAVFECRYAYTVNDLRFQVIIRRDGERYYQALQQYDHDQLSLAWQVAWDGTIATQRRANHMLVVDRQAHRQWQASPAPFDEVMAMLVPMTNNKRLISGPKNVGNSEDEVETVWLSADGQTTTSMRQSKKLGWMPTLVTIRANSRGSTTTELLDYTKIDVGGNTIFLPMTQKQETVFESTGGVNHITLVIDPDSLMIDPPFDDTSFRLKAHPQDDVRDRQMMPADRAAFGVETTDEIGWPFAEVYAMHDALAQEAVAQGGRAPQGGSVSSPANLREPSTWVWPSAILIVLGGLVAITALLARFRRVRR